MIVKSRGKKRQRTVDDLGTWWPKSTDLLDPIPSTTSQQAVNQGTKSQQSPVELLSSSHQQITAAVMGSSQFGNVCVSVKLNQISFKT